MDLDLVREKLASVLTEKRFIHSLNVADTVVKMAKHYGADEKRTYIAGLLHDCGKSYKGNAAREFAKETGYEPDEIEWLQPGLLHGVIGEYIARHEYGVTDTEVLAAIRWHITGRAGMSVIEKIIYVSDYIEPGRGFTGVEAMREEAFRNLDRCIVLCANSTIRYVVENGYLLHPKTVETRNHSLLALKA
ncbi:MAG: HD domain-containing protein [Clostridiaceae bacterium]|nr:HD domain-containing protein [Clostridiaceae bacterium]